MDASSIPANHRSTRAASLKIKTKRKLWVDYVFGANGFCGLLLAERQKDARSDQKKKNQRRKRKLPLTFTFTFTPSFLQLRRVPSKKKMQQLHPVNGTAPIRKRSSVDGEATIDDEQTPLLPSHANESHHVDVDNDDVSPLSSGDRSQAEEASPFLGGVTRRQFAAIFGSLMFTYVVVLFDSTILASSHPVITSYFGASHSASWLSTAYLLTSTAVQPVVGRVSDSLGRKTPFVASLGVFTASTVGCALAPSIGFFIAARALGGIGGGGMMTMAAVCIGDMVPVERRGPYQSCLNVAYGVASMAGAALGGLMADNLGWRWEFGCQVPALLLCLAVIVLVLPALQLAAALCRGLPEVVYVLCLVPSALGQGLQFPGTFLAVLGATEQRDQAVVTTTLQLWRSLGAVAGIAGSSLILQTSLAAFLDSTVVGADKEKVVGAVRKSVGVIARLPEPYRSQVVTSYEAALSLTFACCAVLAAISLLLLLPIKLPKLKPSAPSKPEPQPEEA
ncbi:hypothetical protein MAPG_05153 [Magnaporthiopsis poae ATCC 64411]|uniref:Major facilitator superfamily (MFS) profile domain-containing protein n=1 Tax=Magnaporthiopsis poae (strain ATCC 64411 / 73-15) TaxID=644358 RepID=A0A0C4DYM7_MAGP6|nr:hypothetical protein MAPG_05153 [Magnaporthiopsis poae ATCC 64411]